MCVCVCVFLQVRILDPQVLFLLQGRILDPQGRPVMMRWELPLMEAHAAALLEGVERGVERPPLEAVERPPLEAVERPPLEAVERPPLEAVERDPLERDPLERELGKGDVLDVRPPLESPPLESPPFERAVGRGRDGLDVLNIGFGLGLFDEAVRRRHTPRSHTIVEAHADVLRHPKIFIPNINPKEAHVVTAVCP